MERLIGHDIVVYFKCDDTTISGLLIEVEQNYVYVQCEQQMVAVVPKDNVKFYTTARMVTRAIEHVKPSLPVAQMQSPSQDIPDQEDLSENAALTIYVDNELVAYIPVPPTFDIQTCNESVLRVIWGNPDVQNALRGKTQKQLEYKHGEARITTIKNEQEEKKEPEVSFSMGAGAGSPVATQYLNPSDMVQRLNNVVKRGKNE